MVRGCQAIPTEQGMVSRDDSFPPNHLRNPGNGLRTRGHSTTVVFVMLSGTQVAMWELPSTALCGSLHELVAGLFLQSPNPFSFKWQSVRGIPVHLEPGSNQLLAWCVQFQSPVSLTVTVAPLQGNAPPNEYGWKPLRCWRRFCICVNTRLIGRVPLEVL